MFLPKTATVFAAVLILIAIAVVLFAPKPNYQQIQIIETHEDKIDDNFTIYSAIFPAPKSKEIVVKTPKQEWLIYSDRNYQISLVCKYEKCDLADTNETQKVDLRIIDGDRRIFNIVNIKKSLISNAVDLDIYAKIIAQDRVMSSDASAIAALKDEFGFALELRVYPTAINTKVLEFDDKELLTKLQNPPPIQEFNSSFANENIRIKGVKKIIILK